MRFVLFPPPPIAKRRGTLSAAITAPLRRTATWDISKQDTPLIRRKQVLRREQLGADAYGNKDPRGGGVERRLPGTRGSSGRTRAGQVGGRALARREPLG